jgi:ABC-type antimicrobial peptide transport system permease subunit
MDQSLSRSTAIPRLTTSVVSGVSVLALIMAVIGVYGLVAYAVAQRVPEIGIRLALGASPGQLLWLLLRQGMVRVGAGIAAGLIGAWVLTRWLASLLFGVQPHDPTTFAAVGATLIVVTLIAVLLAARRVLRIDPVRALNAE